MYSNKPIYFAFIYLYTEFSSQLMMLKSRKLAAHRQDVYLNEFFQIMGKKLVLIFIKVFE